MLFERSTKKALFCRKFNVCRDSRALWRALIEHLTFQPKGSLLLSIVKTKESVLSSISFHLCVHLDNMTWQLSHSSSIWRAFKTPPHFFTKNSTYDLSKNFHSRLQNYSPIKTNLVSDTWSQQSPVSDSMTGQWTAKLSLRIQTGKYNITPVMVYILLYLTIPSSPTIFGHRYGVHFKNKICKVIIDEQPNSYQFNKNVFIMQLL